MEKVFKAHFAGFQELRQPPSPRPREERMNLDTLTGHLRSHVFHDGQWPAGSSTVTCNIDRFVMMVYINTDKPVGLASSPQFAELSNKPGREPSDTNDETIDVNYEGGRSVNSVPVDITMSGRAA